MAFRKPKSSEHRTASKWEDWISRTRQELASIGLPPEVYLDQAHWRDFLENGGLDWHTSSGFSFELLLAGQLAALHRFLEREYGEAERIPPLLGWVRVRCGYE
ncbi:MAG: hypothetical protein HYY18_05595 [Planctomycetes bacterium]|nr:hypothetical protein [Planctomycetota bacterium]